MAHYLDPKNDLTFKRVFGEHKHLCMSLLNSMLPLEAPIVDIEYQTGELIPELTDLLRNTVVDVRCTDRDNRQFLVEMQLFWSESFKNRVLLNASKAYVRQLNKADKISLIRPVYALNFVNEIFEKSAKMKDVYFHHYKIVNIKDTEKQIKGLEFFFVELPKFKTLNRAEKKLQDLWLRFLTEVNENTTTIPQELLDNKEINEAISYMELGAYTKAQLFTYDKWKIDVLTEGGIIDDAREEGLAEGITQGITQGMAQGMAQGITQGITQGRTEEKIKIAIKMLEKDIPLEDINDMTGLSIQQIEEIQKKY